MLTVGITSATGEVDTMTGSQTVLRRKIRI